MSGSWPCRCVEPSPHPNLKGLCRCGGYGAGFADGFPAPFKPIPDKPVTALRAPAPRVPEEER